MELRRLTNLARLLASVLAATALPATMLKVGGCRWNHGSLFILLASRWAAWAAACARERLRNLELLENHFSSQHQILAAKLHPPLPPPQAVDFAAALSPREILFWRILFEHLLAACKSADDSAVLFKRCAAAVDRYMYSTCRCMYSICRCM